jgi:hypothetical protein
MTEQKRLCLTDLKEIVNYIHSCQTTGYVQEMSWNEFVAFDKLKAYIEEMEDLE